jgi:FMN-dependent oxidoreductase (nitrilotriacetate monooxygenase family)
MKGLAVKKFHLAWFTNFAVTEWQNPMSSAGGKPWDGRFYVEMAQALERACFDYIMLEDTLMVSDVYGSSTEKYLKNAIHVPKHDPAPLAAVIGSQTSRIGVVATLSTLGYPPFLLARLCATIDHLATGRFGWNIVTSGEDLAAQNFGMDAITAHDRRYDMADEYVALVDQLFRSWDEDAIVMDRETATYADHTKVRPINFVGSTYKCRGPLNTAPSPQGRPAYVQAGGSPRGRDFAARHADSVIAAANGPRAMKAFRDDIRARAASFGRNPDDIKVLFLLAPVLAETTEEARARNERGLSSQRTYDLTLAQQSAFSGIDLSQFDPDQPLPELTTNGSLSILSGFAQWGTGKTLRQLAREAAKGGAFEAIGTPDEVGDQMGEVMQEVGGDGFLIRQPFSDISRRAILDITEGLVPALQRRGLVRTEYVSKTLRETLKEF